MLYGIDNFDKNGFAYPFKLSKKYSDKQLKEEYYNFQNQCKEHLNYPVSLKPNLLSKSFDIFCDSSNRFSYCS